jgi:hypothetical protein
MTSRPGPPAFTTSITGTTEIEGDVDWYRFDSTAQNAATVRVTPPAHDDARAQNFDAVMALYDKDLRLVGTADSSDPAATENLSVTLGVGTYYVAVHNFNGAADSRPYTVAIVPGTSHPVRPGAGDRRGLVAEDRGRR